MEAETRAAVAVATALRHAGVMATEAARKQLVYGLLARIGHGLGSPVRFELLERLADAPRTVDDLAALVGLPLANVSQHLGVLRKAGLVVAAREGRRVRYAVATAEVHAVLAAVRALGLVQARDVERLTSGAPEAEPVDVAGLVRRIRAGATLLLDVRDRAEYDAGHLPRALSVPLPELRRRLRELPRDRPLVAYCRGPFCIMAAEAVALLRRSGRPATALPLGVVEWRASGRRLSTSPAAPSP
jgi:DNA-binding transcriptional ArsR family regulator